MTFKPESFTSWTIQGFFQDGRTEAIEGEFGAAGVLFVLKTWDELYRLKSHRMGKLVWFGKAKKYGFDRERAEALLAALSDLEIDYLHVDEGGIGSNAVDAKCEKRSIERDNWRNKKRGGKKTDDSSPSPDDFQGDSPENGEGFSELSPGESPTPTLTPQPTPQNLNIKNGTSTGAAQVVAAAPLPEAVPPDSPWALHAAAQLVPHDDPRLGRDSRYINAGWRPMRSYPLLWISTKDFCDACEQLEAAGLLFDDGHFALVFKKANAHLEQLHATGGTAKNKSAYAYITGWAKQRVIEELKAESDLARSRSYSKNGGARR